MKLFGIISGAVLLLIAVVFLARPTAPRIVENVDSVEWLPGEASDISYYVREGFGWFRFAEGTMTESDFRSFAASNGWTLKEKKDVHVAGRSVLGRPPLREVYRGIEMDMVVAALVYENRRPNGGGVTWVFDRETSRFYFDESHR